MDFRMMALNIREFVPVLSLIVIKQRINIRYKHILGLEEWEFMHDDTTVTLSGQVASGAGVTVAVATGSSAVVGTGTTFTNVAVGDWMRFGSENQPYKIASITDATNLTLETTYGGSSDLTASAYTTFRTIYTPVVNTVGEIVSIWYDYELYEVSEDWIGRTDPKRVSTGSPTHFRIYSKTKADGIVTFEVWPVPDQAYVVIVNFDKYVPDLEEDTDEPVFRPEFLEAGALWDCYRQAFAVTQNPGWMGMARDAKKDYELEAVKMIMEDQRTSTMSRRVKDTMTGYLFNDNFHASHDIGAEYIRR